MNRYLKTLLWILGTVISVLAVTHMILLIMSSDFASYVFLDILKRFTKGFLKLMRFLKIALLIGIFAFRKPLLGLARKIVGQIWECILIYRDNRQEYSDRVIGQVRQGLDTVKNILESDYNDKSI
ncbi:MAG: hypothetical protein K2N72_14385 [Oscillospiraceae bacterium]|nr:hypothetical protein [Oscillospiraceae bacterium]